MKLAIICALAASASASPLGIAWTEKTACETDPYLPGVTVGDSTLAWISKGKLNRRGIARGDKLAGWKLQHDKLVFIQHLGDNLIVIRDHYGFTVYDGAGKTLFHRIVKQNQKKYNAISVGDGAIFFEVGGLIEADDLKGKKLWTAPFGTSAAEGIRVGATQIYVDTVEAKSRTIHAFAIADGKAAWTWQPDGNPVSLDTRADGDALAVSTNDKVYLVDAAGKLTWKSALADVTVVSVDANRVIVAANNAGMLTALDRATGKQQWAIAHEQRDPWNARLAVGPSSLYTRDHDRVDEVDVATGKMRASFGAAGEKIAGGGKTPTIVTCDGKQLVALSPAAPDIPLEKATITGKLDTNLQGEKTFVEIAGVSAEVKKQKFTLTIEGRGRYEIIVSAGTTPHDGMPVSASTSLALTGKTTYDLGTIKADQVEGADGE